MKRNFSVLNNSLTAAVFSCAILGSVAAHAADSQSYTINLTATVPSDAFQVIPVDAGWINQTQDMGFDIATSKLNVLEKLFQYKNTSGGIQATLTGNLNSDGQPQLSNGTDVIPLAVTFNGVALSKTAATVVTKDDAKIGGRTALKISQANDDALDVSGSFTGSVAMVFEPAVETPDP
ncbi:CS1 type fimbrial major subunit [Kosakonia arachidis]|uniref:CS1 type fimbrial major subunit n=1 Tax=Kosakonia arachidis TaxID=551989 RepID=A0A1I7DTD0_9ENTR|nr:CS1 type fimbrial major subunit [Kosakonia arachidis]SFU14856.1 CS1 type fimbrial major subunit [Kosakonia arachidis]